jgi:tetratricopeptide (TPR) repeat protein
LSETEVKTTPTKKIVLAVLLGAVLTLTAASPDDHAKSPLVLGKIAFTQGDWDKSVREFKKAVHEHPKDCESWLWLGRALGRKAENSNPLRAAFLVGDIRDAFAKAVEMDPKNIDARGDQLDFFLDAPGAFGGGIDRARSAAEAIGKINPADGLQAQSHIEEKEEKFPEAEKGLKAAIDLDPTPGRYRELGEFYKRRKNYPEMEAAFRKSNDQKSYFALAEGLFLQGQRFSDAEGLIRKFLAGPAPEPGDEPTIAQARMLLGQLAARQGHREEAAREFRAALDENPGLKTARKELERLH